VRKLIVFTLYLLAYWDDQVKDDDIVGTCRRRGEMRMHTYMLSINLRSRAGFGDRSLNRILTYSMVQSPS